MKKPYRKNFYLPEIKISLRSKFPVSNRPIIRTPQDAYTILRLVWKQETLEIREEIVLFYLNVNYRLLGWIRLFSGGVDSSLVDRRLIYQIGLVSTATQFIIAHNHPSGNLEPSNADLEMTRHLVRAGRLLQIELMDHIILTKESYASLRKNHKKLWKIGRV